MQDIDMMQVSGECRAIAAFQGCVAVGTASGALFVLMPRSVNTADGKATGCASCFAEVCHASSPMWQTHNLIR